MRPLLAALLLLGLAFAAVPPAAAEPVPPGPCYEKSYVDNGLAHVYTTMGCATFVDLLETECFWGGHWTTVAHAGNVYVRTWSCSPEYADMAMSCTCDPNPWLLLVRAILVAAPCIADAAAYEVYHSTDVNPVAGDCVVDAYPPYECVGGWGEDRTVSLGFVRVVVRVCTGGPLTPVGQ
jgi:hypothetical protein